MNYMIQFKEKENLFEKLDLIIKKKSNIFVWVSWWPDSTFLLEILKNFIETRKLVQTKLIILHYNHWYRKESKKEEKILKKIYEKKDIIIWKYESDDYSENSLRKARYEFFYDSVKKFGFLDNDYLVLWHNLTDRIETSLMNMMRGSDIQGIINMKFYWDHFNGIKIIRPLINMEKQYITELCDKNWINYFIDKTNEDINFSKRNQIRKDIISKMVLLSNKDKNWNINLFESFLKLYEFLELKKDDKEIELKSIKLSKFWNAKWWFEYIWNITELQHIVNLFKELLIYKNIYRNTINEFFKFMVYCKSWNKSFNWVHFFKSHWKIYIIKASINFYKKSIEQIKKIDKIWEYEIWDFVLNIKNKKYVWWVLRFPQKNDKFGKKSIFKIMINKKIPIFRRNFIPIIEKDWIIYEILNHNND